MRNEILIVDDNPENLRVLSQVLKRAGYEIRAATNGSQALASIEAEEPDLVLLDVHMTDMSGFEVCQKVKDDPRFDKLPILFLSALDDAVNKVQGFESGAVDYITKPFDADEVLARVSTHLTLRRTQDQLTSSFEKLQRLEKLRANLLHMIVHDLKSPLFALNTSLEFLREDTAEMLNADTLDTLDNILSTGGELAQMVDQLLDINQLEEGRMPIDCKPCDFAELVSTAVDAVKGISPEREIHLDIEQPAPVSCDAHLVRRVVENLVSNGLIHTPPEKPLTIEVRRGTDDVLFAVRDEGSGVPEDLKERIFEKFASAQARKDGQYHSSGLGLAFCKLAVEAHDGTIGVESENGQGSTFWFSLPDVSSDGTAVSE